MKETAPVDATSVAPQPDAMTDRADNGSSAKAVRQLVLEIAVA